MSKYLSAALGIAVMLIASTALARERSALESASVKAATDCVAAAALKDRNIVTLYRENRLKEITNRIVLQSGDCDNPLAAMRLLHDRLYGTGTGRTFLLGDYLADLPRAVGERIGSETDSEPPVPMKTLAACESTSVTDTLASVVEKSTRGRTLGIEVFKVDPRRLRNTADKRFCAALLWTSAGKQVVNYTVEWMNRETGQLWVEFRWM